MAKIKATTDKQWPNKYCSKLYEEFEDTKRVIRICKSKTDRQYNDKMNKDKQRPPKWKQKTIN